MMLSNKILAFLLVSTLIFTSSSMSEDLTTTATATEPTESQLDNPNYFEGDLDISQAVIDAYYQVQNDSQLQTGHCTRAIRDRNILWPSGIVYYTFNSSVDNATQVIILEAMNKIENKTCIRFESNPSNDHIEFTGEGEGCSSSSVGKSEGKQFIRLPATTQSTCRTEGIVLHQICHALGLWHEQSRPDRNDYIKILEENINPDKLRNFQKRNTFEFDYFGQMYDYGSIMHYGKDYFSKSENATISVVNEAEYICQGNPVLGQRSHLSAGDITKINQMYKCPGSGYGTPGYLTIHVKNGIALGWTGGSAPYRYVQITAVDNSGRSSSYATTAYQANPDVEWNQWIDFGERMSWQYFEVSVWNYYRYNADSQVTSTQKFTVSQGYQRNLRYCDGQSCTSRVYLDYNLKQDVNDCEPDPCTHGTCTDRFFAYLCNCPPGYSGLRCEEIRGSLRIFARYGSGLPDHDSGLSLSDPYIFVESYNQNGDRKTLSTRIEMDTLNPQWNEWLSFGEDIWSRFSVTVYNDNGYSRDSLMSNTSSYYFPTHTSHSNERKYCNSGYVEFDYYFQP